MYIHMCIYTCVYTHVYIHVHIHVYIHVLAACWSLRSTSLTLYYINSFRVYIDIQLSLTIMH